MDAAVNRLLEVQDVAKLTGLSPQWIRTQTDLGFLPCQRTARGLRLFRAADVSAFIERRRQERESVQR